MNVLDMEAGNSMHFFPVATKPGSNDAHNSNGSKRQGGSSNQYFLDGLFANTTDAEPQSPHLGPTSFGKFVKTPATITQLRNIGSDAGHHYDFGNIDEGSANDLDDFDLTFDVFSPSSDAQRKGSNVTSVKNKSIKKSKTSNKRKHSNKRKQPSSAHKRQKIDPKGPNAKTKEKPKIKELDDWDKEDIAAFDKALYRKRDMRDLDMTKFVVSLCLDLKSRNLSTSSVCSFYRNESQKMMNVIQQSGPHAPNIGQNFFSYIKALRIFRKLWTEDFAFISLRVLGWERSSRNLTRQFTNRLIERINHMLNHDDDDGVTVVVNERGKGTLPEKVFKVPSNIGLKQRIKHTNVIQPKSEAGRKIYSVVSLPNKMALTNNAVRSTPRVAPGSGNVANDDPKSTFSRKQPGESTNAANSITFNVPMTSRTATLNKNVTIQLYPRTDRTKSVAKCSQSTYKNPMVRYSMLSEKPISLVLEALAKRFTVKQTVTSHPYFFSNQKSPSAHLPRLWPFGAVSHTGWGSEHVSLTLNDILLKLQHAAMAVQIQQERILLKLEYDWV